MDGIAFNSYRSIGTDSVYIGPLSKINFLVGQNNVGKSNVISYLVEQLPHFQSYREEDGEIFDIPINGPAEDTRIAFHLNEESLEAYSRSLLSERDDIEDHIEKCLLAIKQIYSGEDGMVWFEYIQSKESPYFRVADYSHKLNDEDAGKFRDLQLALTSSAAITRGPDSYTISEVLNTLLEKLPYRPTTIEDIVLVPAIRKVDIPVAQFWRGGKEETQPNLLTYEKLDFSGMGLIARLVELESPTADSIHDKKLFERINVFLRNVLNNQTASLQIPHTRTEINVEIDGKVLPLASVGSGVDEIIMLATAATVLQNSLVCIEEPELHLHPTLQKRLISYLNEQTNNKYLIATHSAHFLDTVPCSIFHVKLLGDFTKVSLIDSFEDRREICRDLGYRASDIVQSNCVIWVEGPSDRYYLNYLLNKLHPEFKEGVHYSIFFYAGILNEFITIHDVDDDSYIDDLISLTSLNQNSILVVDSDRNNSKAELKSAVKRLEMEFNETDRYIWITAGREIENYIPLDIIEKAILELHPRAQRWKKQQKFGRLLKRKKSPGAKDQASKTKIAKILVESGFESNLYDLQDRLSDIGKIIMAANGVKPNEL